ncbi:MAG: cupin domain-containing protein [Clostridiales bacterium]|nr:cupin domain-containing protein [Clostridiales bacterium]
MIIDYSKIEEKTNPNFKGGELEFNVKTYEDEHNKVMRGRLIPGATIGYHTHENDSEIIYVISGHGTMVNDDGSEPVNPGEVHYCGRGRAHSLQNTGNEDLIFIGIVPKG